MAESGVQSLLLKRHSPVKRFVLLSVLAHAVLVLVAIGLSQWMSGPPVDLNQKPIKASLVRLGKPRDEKLLPRMEEPAPAAAPPKAQEALPAKVKEKTVPVPTLKKEGKTSASSEAAAEKEKKQRLASAFSKVSKGRPAELEGAQDGDVNGNSARQEGEKYYALMQEQVKRFYDVSSTISEQERIRLKSVVLIRIGNKGELLQSELKQSSGNGLFDASVLAAIKKATPFPFPPEYLKDTLRQGIWIEFTP